VFRCCERGNYALVEIQKSRKSVKDKILFTVNLGIVCSELLKLEDPNREPGKCRVVDAHLRLRLGMLLPGRRDKWWEITECTPESSLEQEVCQAVVESGVPYLEQYLKTHALLRLWESGESPGLTEGERLEALGKLRKIIGEDR